MLANELAEKYFRIREFKTVGEFLEGLEIIDNELEKEIKDIVDAKEGEIIKHRERLEMLIDQEKTVKLKDGDKMMILHRCTDGEHKYQISHFFKEEPYSDTRHNTKREVVEELMLYRNYEITEII